MNQSQSQAPTTTLSESFLARLLDPVDRLVEAIYSVLIILTFTLTYNVVDANTDLGQPLAASQLSQLFVAALGCAVARAAARDGGAEIAAGAEEVGKGEAATTAGEALQARAGR